MRKERKTHPCCKTCNTRLVSWGITTSGKKRYRCQLCKQSRTYRVTTEQVLFSLFRQYILFGHTYEMLNDESGYSIGHLIRVFHHYLSQEPPLVTLKPAIHDVTFLLVDGLWLKKWYVMMVYRRSKDLTILLLLHKDSKKIIRSYYFYSLIFFYI